MRACLIGPAPPLRGGIALHTAGLAAALSRRGHDVDVLSYSRVYPRILFPGTRATEDRSPVGAALLDTMDPRTWIRARRFLAERSPDLVIAQWWHPCAAAALASVLGGSDARVVVVCHNARPHGGVPMWRSLTRLVLGTADLAVCHSRFVAHELSALTGACEYAVTQMPLLLAPGRARVRRRAARPTALFVGLVRHYKGVDVLLEAWDRAVLPPGSRLVVAGESYLGRGRLERLVKRTERRDSVEVTNRWLSDAELWEHLRGTDVLLLPYVRASQSGLLPLALAAGVRIVTTDAGGLAEMLPRSKKHVVCKAGDVHSLAAALSLVLSDSEGYSDDAARLAPQEAVDIVARSWDTTVSACERVATASTPLNGLAAGPSKDRTTGGISSRVRMFGAAIRGFC
jgi:glycosyltransferase involved in cell wall biosynthesis